MFHIAAVSNILHEQIQIHLHCSQSTTERMVTVVLFAHVHMDTYLDSAWRLQCGRNEC